MSQDLQSFIRSVNEDADRARRSGDHHSAKRLADLSQRLTQRLRDNQEAEARGEIPEEEEDAPEEVNDDSAPRLKPSRCSDGFCGADDCSRCRPGTYVLDQDDHRTFRGIFTRGIVLALFAISSAYAVEWSRYDTQLHFACGALGSYIICDTLAETTSLKPWQRFLIGSGTMTLAGWAYEELNGNGLREAGDAHATTIGGLVGASAHTGFSLLVTPKNLGMQIAWKF